jgi:phage major head subunit gpT-like protein
MVSGTTIVAAEQVFRTIFNQALQAFAGANPWTRLASLATEVPSTGPQEIYRWLSDLPMFEEWIGDLNVDDLAEASYTLVNKHFAKGVGVDEDELADDKMGLIRSRIEMLAVRYLQHIGQQIENLLLNGATNLAFDGIAFFANASGVRLIDNLGAGTISAATPTLAQVEADVRTARATVQAFVDSRSEIIGLVPMVFAGHPQLEILFGQLMQSTTDPNAASPGASNPYRSMIRDYIPLPRATDLNDLYAFVVDMPVKPFIYQNRQALNQELVRQALNRKLIFKADYRAGYGYSLPHLAVKLVSAAA